MRNRYLAIVLVLLGFPLAAQRVEGALIINLDFSSFSSGAPSNGSAVLGGSTLAQAQSVIQTAADYWEAAFAGSSSSLSWATSGNLTQNISVGWGAQGGSTLATGGTSWFVPSGQWAPGAALTFDNDGTSNFFVDSTPTDHLEWNQFSQRSMAFNSVNVNVERVYFDAPAGTARDNADLLTVAIHEIGHALGFLNTYPQYEASDLGNDNDIDITSGTFTNAQIPINGGHTNFQLLSPSTQFPYNPGGGGFFTQFNYYPNVMGPSIVPGTRQSLTEADIAIVAQFLQFDMSTVNFNPSISAVPEPSSWLAFALLFGFMFYTRLGSIKSIYQPVLMNVMRP
jgi:hypothetical protein